MYTYHPQPNFGHQSLALFVAGGILAVSSVSDDRRNRGAQLLSLAPVGPPISALRPCLALQGSRLRPAEPRRLKCRVAAAVVAFCPRGKNSKQETTGFRMTIVVLGCVTDHVDHHDRVVKTAIDPQKKAVWEQANCGPTSIALRIQKYSSSSGEYLCDSMCDIM